MPQNAMLMCSSTKHSARGVMTIESVTIGNAHQCYLLVSLSTNIYLFTNLNFSGTLHNSFTGPIPSQHCCYSLVTPSFISVLYFQILSTSINLFSSSFSSLTNWLEWISANSRRCWWGVLEQLAFQCT